VIVALIVVAIGATAVIVLLGGTAPPSQATLDRVTITAAKTTIDQREELVLTAEAFDTSNVDRSADTSFAWSANPPSRVQGATGAGVSKTVTAIEAGSVTVTATATLNSVTRAGNLALTISALTFRLTPSTATPMVGQAFDLNVEVLRGTTAATSYRGTVTFTSDDTLATLPPNTAFGANDNGVRLFSGLVVRQARDVVITAADTIATIVGTTTVTGQRPPNAPLASFVAVRNLRVVDVDASGSTDPDNDIASYSWNWGDLQTSGPLATPTASHTYSTPGKYTITLTVTDLTSTTDVTTRDVTVADSTLDYRFYGFFEDPFQEYWDIRQVLYFERPINAECFSPDQRGADGIPATGDEVCIPSNPSVPDFSTYPYTNWYSGDPVGDPAGVPYLYGRYRFNVTGTNVPGYNTSEPVFLPVLNYSAASGARLDVQWDLHYMNSTLSRQREVECATNFVFSNDGYIIESIIRIEMDLQESRRIFGVVGGTTAEAQAWWSTNTNPVCRTPNRSETGPAERAVINWFVAMGGSQTTVGKYDIATGYEWYYQVFALNMTATVDPTTGDTTVMIYHTAYGTEVLLGRFFYWGNTSYEQNYLDSTKRTGWIGQEVAWYEDLFLDAQLGPADVDFGLDSSLAYHFVNTCDPGPNNVYDRTDDVSVWAWGPYLDDYVPDFGNNHPLSELDRYSGGETYVSCAPGAPTAVYGQPIVFDVVPTTWDAQVGETLTFEFPTGDVRFYDPNLTPAGADPKAGAIAEAMAPMSFGSASPAGHGTWDALTNTWTIIGPESTGGPDGSPGNYPLQPWPLLNLVPVGTTLAPASPPAKLGTEGLSSPDVAEGSLAAGPFDREAGMASLWSPANELTGRRRAAERIMKVLEA
jgi:hypothetical protein